MKTMLHLQVWVLSLQASKYYTHIPKATLLNTPNAPDIYGYPHRVVLIPAEPSADSEDPNN